MSSRVLVIDDSPLFRTLLEDVLGAAGYSVNLAGCGEEGLEQARRSAPDVVLCDLHMPGLSGIEVVEHVKRDWPLTPVLIFTESNDLKSAVEAMQRGAFGYLTKDMADDALLGELKKAVEHAGVLRRNRELELANQRYQQELEQMVEGKTREIARLHAVKAHAEKLAAMGSFVAGVAHEINNPLAVVRANTRFLIEEAPPLISSLNAALAEDVTEALEEMEVCSTRMQRIIDGLRRLAHHGAHPKRESSLLSAAVKDIEVVCRARVPEGVTVKWEVDAPAGCRVGMSLDDMVMVASNLVVNSVHAIEDARRAGVISLRWRAQGESVVMEVEDNGCGIPAGNLSRVFDAFYTSKAVGRGTGLGLSLVHQVVKNADGEVNIESVEGQGTKVKICLPLRSAESTTADAAPAPIVEGPARVPMA